MADAWRGKPKPAWRGGYGVGFCAPEWHWFWESAILLWPLLGGREVLPGSPGTVPGGPRDYGPYNRRGVLTRGTTADPYGFRRTNRGTHVAMNGTWSITPNVQNLGPVNFFCSSGSQPFTIACVARVQTNQTGTLFGKAGSTSGNRTLHCYSFSGAFPVFLIRGTVTDPGWDLDDGNWHIIWFVWNGSAATAFYDDAKGAASLTLGSASIESELFRVGTRTDTSSFALTGDVEALYVFRRALSRGRMIQLFRDFYGAFRPHGLILETEDQIAAGPAAAAGPVAKKAMYHYRIRRTA